MTGYEKGVLNGLVKIPPGRPRQAPSTFSEARGRRLTAGSDAWYAEDEKLLGTHPKDPLQAGGVSPIDPRGPDRGRRPGRSQEHEQHLPARDHAAHAVLPAAHRDPGLERAGPERGRRPFCPYKGQASYYHLKVGDREIKDAIWYYVYPTPESALIQGRLCFYNEKVDVFIDGELEKK